jgi:hypothetical protein
VHDEVTGQDLQRAVRRDQVIEHPVEQYLDHRVVGLDAEPLRHIEFVGLDRPPIGDDIEYRLLAFIAGRDRQALQRGQVGVQLTVSVGKREQTSAWGQGRGDGDVVWLRWQ